VTRPTRRIARPRWNPWCSDPATKNSMPNALKTKSLEGVPFPSNHLSVEETYQTT